MDNRIEFPERPLEHIKEEISFDIFKKLVHQSWIVRDVRTHDYGVDFFVETVSLTNRVLPHIIRIQSKYREKINEPIYIKRTTFNYLSQSTNATFLFVTNGEISKIMFMNDHQDSKDTENVKLVDEKFDYINTPQELLDILCYNTYIVANEKKVIIYYNYVAKSFKEIFFSIKNNITENMISLYSNKPKVFNNICMFNFRAISLFSEYIKNSITIDDLKYKIGNIDKIKDVMTMSLIMINCVSKKYNLYINDDIKREFISYLDNMKNENL
jgi:hypothetical protein